MALVDSAGAHRLPLEVNADGVVRVGGTRVTLDTVVGEYLDGATPEEIVLAYDSLHLADVYSAIREGEWEGQVLYLPP